MLDANFSLWFNRGPLTHPLTYVYAKGQYWCSPNRSKPK